MTMQKAHELSKLVEGNSLLESVRPFHQGETKWVVLAKVKNARVELTFSSADEYSRYLIQCLKKRGIEIE